MFGISSENRIRYQFESNLRCQGPQENDHFDRARFRLLTEEILICNLGDLSNVDGARKWPFWGSSELKRAISFASQLAFTDWNTNLKTMSARSAHGTMGTILVKQRRIDAPTVLVAELD